MIHKKIKQILSSVLLILVLLVHVAVVPVQAEETAIETAPATTEQTKPTAPEAPAAPVAPEAPTAPAAPTPPTQGTPPVAPTAPAAPTPPQKPGNQNTNNLSGGDNNNSEGRNNRNRGNQTQNSQNIQPTQNGGTSGSGNVGDTDIATGDANNNSSTTTVGNTNASAGGTGSGSGASVSNTGNGSASQNSGSVGVGNTNNTNQSNSANVGNNVNQSTVTGNNSASMNVGNSNVTTGDANTTGTIITAVNTNVDGVMVAEFNIVDDHVGDVVLDFGSASSCVVGCGGGNLSATNTGNGAGSDNNSQVNSMNTDNTFQSNEGDVENNMVLNADSGHNDANLNTGGDSTISTGDANVSANVLTFLNNNLAGNVVLGVVNIFGDLVGDIIFQDPGAQNCSTCGGGNIAAGNTGNGAYSDNSAGTNSTNTNNTFQSNDANIENNLILDAQSGNNDVNGNTDGDSSITTGSTSIDANVLNIANMNIAGGDVWLVIVNEAGNWIGRILGAPEGSNFAGSVGTEFMVGPNGEITAYNSGNGAGSNNVANTSSSNTNNTTQTNTANVVNNIDLSANTGGNSASYNTGGKSSITTGDAAIIANLVNFVNNNVTGGGKLYVNVVNVFGSWMGDFVTPGHQKSPKPTSSPDNTAHVGGQSSSLPTPTSTSKKVTPAPTEDEQVAAIVAAKKKQVTLGTGNTSPKVLGTVVSASEDKEGGKAQTQETSQEDDALKINLAWLLAFAPIVPLGFVERKYGFIKSATNKLLSILL